MRYLKRVLTTFFIYTGVFAVVCLICNICGIQIQETLIQAVCGFGGVEIIIGGGMKIFEIVGEIKKAKIESAHMQDTYSENEIGKKGE